MTPQSDTPNARARRRPWMRAFLAVLAETGNVTRSAEAAQVARKTAYRARDRDAHFAAEWTDALDRAADALELEARRRAIEGWEEPVFQRGSQVGVIRRYSDRLLIELLRAHRPHRYCASQRERLLSRSPSNATDSVVIYLPHNDREQLSQGSGHVIRRVVRDDESDEHLRPPLPPPYRRSPHC